MIAGMAPCGGQAGGLRAVDDLRLTHRENRVLLDRENRVLRGPVRA
jgi:hypothetical protein